MIRRIALSGILVAWLPLMAHAATWSDVWLTREQQAQRLLDANQPAAAANLFSDPRRQAYADLRAGQYAKAAKLLEPFKDADSQYNRGNALAHTGRLREALQAYDAALTSSPGNRDALRNRDLVRQALQQQQNSQQQAGGNGQSGGGKGEQKSANGRNGAQPDRSGAKQNSPGAGGQQQQSARNQGQSGQSGQTAQSEQPRQSGQSTQAGNQSQAQANPSQSQQSSNSSQSANAQQSASQAQAARQGQSSGQSQSGGNEQSATAGQPQDSSQQSGGNSGQKDAQAARADAEAALKYQQSQQARAGTAQSQTGPDSMGAVNPRAGIRQPDNSSPPPPTEQSLALDQWLRGIPEDSGELLQRKFLIEHMLRQRGNEP
jgi:Ca-activated chloride channel homolog